MNNLKSKLADAVAKLGESASDVAMSLKSHALGAWNAVQHRTQDAARGSAIYARRHPLPTALIAAGIGLVVVFFLSRRAPAAITAPTARLKTGGHGLKNGVKPLKKTALKAARKLAS